MEKRITPEIVKNLLKDQCLVIGTNEGGIHGAGIAKLAADWGFPYRMGFGLYALTETHSFIFGIPTKDWRIKSLDIEIIRFYVNRFIECTKLMPGTTFLVSKIGCGLAGFTPEDIAPLFMGCDTLENIHLPIEFWNVIDNLKLNQISEFI